MYKNLYLFDFRVKFKDTNLVCAMRPVAVIKNIQLKGQVYEQVLKNKASYKACAKLQGAHKVIGICKGIRNY